MLAGGPLGAWPATLPVRSRLVVVAGQLAVVGAVGGALLGLEAVDGCAGPLPFGPLDSVVRLRAEGPVRVVDAVGVSLVLDLGGGLEPSSPAPGRLGHRAEGLEDIAGPLLLDGHAGGAALPGKVPDDLPILRAKVGVGLQPAVAALLVLAQLPLPVVGPVGLLGGHRQPTRHLGRLVVAAPQPAKHP